MSIANITTFGFGSFSSVNSAVLIGYLDTSTPVTVTVDTHDYPVKKKHHSKQQVDDYRAHLDKLEDKLAKLEDEKTEKSKELRTSIEDKVRPKQIVAEIKANEEEQVLLAAEIETQKKIARKAKDEYEMQIIMDAIYGPITEYFTKKPTIQ